MGAAEGVHLPHASRAGGRIVPCYEPPRPDRHDYDEMTRQRDRYIATLKEVEDECKANLPHALSTMSEISGQVLAQRILDIIDSHWRQP